MTATERNAPDRIAAGALSDFATAVFGAAGLSDADALLSADTLVQADLWGHQSHGVLRLSWYARACGPACAIRAPCPSWSWMPAASP